MNENVLVPALYEADVVHVRRSPVAHSFRYRTAYWLVDYDELPQPRGWARWITSVRSADHTDVRAHMEGLGIRAARVVMLTGARALGYVFNPISVFWCYDDSGAQCAVVAEVHNTYGERHAYVLRPDADGGSRVEKRMYVSPFNRVDGTYLIEVSKPGPSLSVAVRLERPGEEPFVATLQGSRQRIRFTTVVRSVLRHSGLRNRVRIQWQALCLWRRGLMVQPR